jgi:hypothetical protein
MRVLWSVNTWRLDIVPATRARIRRGSWLCADPRESYSDVILALHSRRVFTFGVAGAMARYRRTICGCLALAALAGVAGCVASGPEPPFETAYSAVGAQVK